MEIDVDSHQKSAQPLHHAFEDHNVFGRRELPSSGGWAWLQRWAPLQRLALAWQARRPFIGS